LGIEETRANLAKVFSVEENVLRGGTCFTDKKFEGVTVSF